MARDTMTRAMRAHVLAGSVAPTNLRPIWTFLALLFLAAVPADPQEKKVKAPELEGGLGWLNTDRPLTLAELKGKIVLLDFWTYC